MQTDDMTKVSTTTDRWVRLAGDGADNAIDGFELFSARRALKLLKEKLGRQSILHLLSEEITAGNAFLRDHIKRSEGMQATGTTVLDAHGTTAAAFVGWLGRAFAREEVMLAGHPEHYSIHAEPGRGPNIVETLGEYVCSFFMREWNDNPLTEQNRPDVDAKANARHSQILLEDGTVVGSISTAFEEAPGGFTATLSVTLPVTCAPDVIQQHLEHFAVEFRTWILRSIAEQG